MLLAEDQVLLFGSLIGFRVKTKNMHSKSNTGHSLDLHDEALKVSITHLLVDTAKIDLSAYFISRLILAFMGQSLKKIYE